MDAAEGGGQTTNSLAILMYATSRAAGSMNDIIHGHQDELWIDIIHGRYRGRGAKQGTPNTTGVSPLSSPQICGKTLLYLLIVPGPKFPI